MSARKEISIITESWCILRKIVREMMEEEEKSASKIIDFLMLEAKKPASVMKDGFFAKRCPVCDKTFDTTSAKTKHIRTPSCPQLKTLFSQEKAQAYEQELQRQQRLEAARMEIRMEREESERQKK